MRPPGGLVSSLLPGPPGALPALGTPFRAASGEPAGMALPGHEERFRISRFMTPIVAAKAAARLAKHRHFMRRRVSAGGKV